jgi:chromosome segregation ATPase
MEDLQILEQQQREAQRQLASARLTKEHRLQQQLSLENQLGGLKYSNGEMRAQISQARDLLAAASREFGARRLASNRAADRIRAFDQKLRKGLLSARMISEKRRKIESLLTVGRNKRAILRRLQEEVNDKLGVLEKQNIDAKQYEESLRKSIQMETSASQEHITATAILRSKNKVLEQELITAQTAGESTKLEADAVADAVQREKKRHEEAAAALKMKLQSRMRVNDDLSKQTKSTKQDLDEKTELLHSAWTRCMEYQKEERHDICPPPTDPQAIPPVFDMVKLRRSVEDEDCILRNHQSGRQQLQGNVDKLRAELDRLQEETRANLEKAPSILEVALHEQKNEEERRLRMTECLKEVVNARTEVSDLLNRCKQREEDMVRRASSHSQQVLEHKEAITRDRQAIARDKSRLETEKAASDNFLASWEHEKSTIQEKLIDSKKRAEDSKNALAKLQAEETSLVNRSPNPREDESRVNKEGQVACEEIEEEISRVLKGTFLIDNLIATTLPSNRFSRSKHHRLPRAQQCIFFVRPRKDLRGAS